VRLLIKNGNTWIVQRGFAGTNPPTTLSAVNAGALLITLATSCYFGADAPCDEARTDWNVSDAYGLNPTLTTIVKDPSEQGCCHATHQNGVNVSQGIQCPLRDGIQYGCYFARFNGYPAAFSDPGFFVTSNAPFHGIVGVGYPNSVDSHPSHTQFSASDVENGWVGDARPFIGDAFGNLSGTAASPATNIQGSLWKLTSSQLGRLRPRVLTTVATCGSTPLLDVSGPASTITGASTDAFKYCIATNAGECVSNSSAGDAYANCPQTRVPYCTFQGVGQSDPDTRDICIFDMGSYTMNAVQIGVRKADPNGVRGRRVTSGFSRYHWVNPYWNVKILPDARWMIVWSTFFQGVRNSALLVKLPPFPEPVNNYGDYFPVTTTVPPPSIPGVNNAVVQFGYGKNLFCTSRQEVCVQGSAATFAYQGENPSGVPCANGCTIQVPAIPQRVLYYQIVLRDSQNAVLKTLPMEIRAVQ
jgi:hypothetical protein